MWQKKSNFFSEKEMLWKKISLLLFSFWLNFAKEKNWWQHLSINEGSLFALFCHI
jgi:hypothetical protein